MEQNFANLPSSADQMTDIIEIAGVLPSPFLFWSKVVIATLIVLLALLLLYWIFKKIIQSIRNRRLSLSADERALSYLTELKKKDFLGQGRIHFYYFRLDEILREFIDAQFGLTTRDQTFEELSENERKISGVLTANQFKKFQEFWQRAQFAKFAKADSDREQCLADFNMVQRFVVHAAKNKPNKKKR